MKIKTLAVFCSLIITAIATTSCLNKDEETIELSPNASITAFSINDIETKYTSKTSSGKDTTITVTVTGSEYPFVIDQNRRLIYNVDSLPVGTDVSRVVVNITSDSNYIIIVNQKESNKDSLWVSTDSINFESPIQMKVLALNNTLGHAYTTQINVHKQVPDSLTWSKLGSNIVATNAQKQKSVFFKNNILVACNIADKAMMTSTSMTDGKSWTTPTEIPLTGVDISSLMVWGEKLYILASNTLYVSNDGNTWQAVSGAPLLKALVANYYESASVASLSAISTNNKFVDTPDGVTWTEGNEVSANFPTENLSYAAITSTHNSSIYRKLVMGNNSATNDSVNNAWGKLSTENSWVEYTYNNNGYYCPNLENITMIHYNDALYAFGGKSQNGTKKPFSNFYISNNNGANWKSISSLVKFPTSFATLYQNAGGHYSCTVDSNNFIWIIFSNSNEVWKGRINKLGFK